MNENNTHDALKEIFRRKLEDYRAFVEPSDWEVINKRLNGNSRKKIIVMWSSIAASVAIILAMAMTILHYAGESDPVFVNHNFPENPDKYSETQNDKPALVSDSETEISQRQPQNGGARTQGKHNNDNYKDLKGFKGFKDLKDFEDFNDNNNNNGGSRRQPEGGEKQPKRSLTETQTERQHHFPVAGKGKHELLLAASFYTIGDIGTNTPLQSPYSETKIYAHGDKVLFPNKALIPDNTSGEYLPPLSFGLTVRKNINTHWGIETGLVYTYLSSHYRWHDATPFDATQQLHYLGIPVTGIVYLYNNNRQKWNVYVSAGVMSEKGLRMKTVRDQHLPDRVKTTTQNSGIDGWQWSLNGSVGVGYRLVDKINLYFEPRVGYYFAGDQPGSIRTDRPVSVGFGAGLQYSF